MEKTGEIAPRYTVERKFGAWRGVDQEIDEEICSFLEVTSDREVDEVTFGVAMKGFGLRIIS